MFPQDPVQMHFTRLRPEQKKALGKLGIRTIRDLLYHFPARYEQSGSSTTIASAAPGAEVTLYGTIRKPDVRKGWKSRRPMAEATLEDASGRIKLMWFNQPYIAKTLADGQVVKVTGMVTGTAQKPYIANASIERSPLNPEEAHDTLFAAGADNASETLYPIYPESQGVSSLWFLHAMKRVFAAHAHEAIEDPIPADILARYKLPALAAAFLYMHAPRQASDAAAAT